jgi:hypothetical protein
MAKEIPRTLQDDLIGDHATTGPNAGKSVAQVQDAMAKSGLVTQSESEGTITVALPANTNIDLVKATFSGGDLLIQYWDQTQGGGVGAYVTLKTIENVTKAIVAVKLCLMDSVAPSLSWQALTTSGAAIIAGWFELNAQSASTPRMVGGPQRILRDNLGSAPLVTTDEGTEIMVESLPLTRTATLTVTSNQAIVPSPFCQIPFEVSVTVLG